MAPTTKDPLATSRFIGFLQFDVKYFCHHATVRCCEAHRSVVRLQCLVSLALIDGCKEN